jgi:hypothetical protein
MTVLGSLAADSNWAIESVFDRPTLLKLMMRSEVLSLSIHIVLASFAVAAAHAMWRLSDRRGAEERSPDAELLLRRLARWSLWPTLLQLPVGAWALISTGERSRGGMMGDNLLATAAFGIALIGALALMHALASIAMGETQHRACRRAGWLLVVVAVFMTMAMRASRANQHEISRASARAVEQCWSRIKNRPEPLLTAPAVVEFKPNAFCSRGSC